MLNLPKTTEIQKQLPKTQIYKKFQLSNLQQTKFDADIARIDFANQIDPSTIPSIQPSENVKSIYILSITLKTKDYKRENIELIAKLISQKMVFVLQFETQIQLAVFCEKLLTTKWSGKDEANIGLDGFSLDEIWKNIVKQILGGEWDDKFSLEENVKRKEKKENFQKKIDRLEKQARGEKQHRKKFDLLGQIRALEAELRNL